MLFILCSMAAYSQLTAAQYKLKSLEANSENGDFGTAFYGPDKIVFSSKSVPLKFVIKNPANIVLKAGQI